MKGKLLAWLLLMILTILALTVSSFPLANRQGDVNLRKPILHEQTTIHVRLNGSEEDYGRGSKNEQEDLIVTENGQKGKIGVSGGGGSSHRPHKEKNSATPRPRLMAKTMFHVGFTLILVLSFKSLL